MHVNGMNMHKTSQNYKLHLFTHYYLCYYTRNPSTPQRHFPCGLRDLVGGGYSEEK